MEPARTDIPDVGWFVNKPVEIDAGGLPDYLARGAWVSPTPAEHARLLAGMHAGESIALKSVTNQTVGLPFFNADRPVSTMTIFATGRVRSVDAVGGTVGIDWNPPAAPRPWYFWTGIRALWRVQADPDTASVRLLDFTFNGAPQDLAQYLADPFWRDRYPPQPGFSWIPFYTELARRLAEYRADRAPLLEWLARLSATEPLLRYLAADQAADGTTGLIVDIDPFTLFGTFNRTTTDDNRRRIASLLADQYKLRAEIPDDFDGIPLLDPRRSWFFRFAKDRDPGDIDRLWDVFLAALALADDDTPSIRERFAAAYDAARANRGVNWNLSQGLFWARPNRFMTLDGYSRAFIKHRFGLAAPEDGAGYLALLDALRRHFDSGETSITSFPLLSYAAWIGDNSARFPASLTGLASWAVMLAESADLDRDENDYKRATAEQMRAARDALRAGDSAWPALFKRALAKAHNLLHFTFKDSVAKAAAADPAVWATVLGSVWDAPVPESLDRFRELLAHALGHVTPGNATGLGALLCLAEDPEANAPYLSSRTEKWYRLTGFDGPQDNSSPADRYGTLLRFLDALCDEIEQHTGQRPSRLEAQGMAWAASENAIPAGWDVATRTALLTWRNGGKGVEPPRAWLVRPQGVPVERWLDDGYVALAATRLGDVPPGSDPEAIKAAVEQGYAQADSAERQALAADYHAFLSRMRPADLICTLADGRLYLGRITGSAGYADEAPDDRLRRTTDWLTAVPIEPGLPPPLPSLLEQQGGVVDLTDGLDALERLIELPPEPVDIPAAPTKKRPIDGPLRLPVVTDSVAASLHMDIAPLQEILDLLHARRQIVLYGPPGTGKTFLALALGRHLVGPEQSKNHQLVQFHPSYAYEDFFEGYRPARTPSGQATFEIVPGPLRRIAAEAKTNPGQPFVLIIDELNRANLAKVFGELYFLLEYRDQGIRLQYNPSEIFRLPPNLYFIGTMNTADRSIALLDAAMRRRFAFVELHPEEPPVRDVLARYLSANGQADDPRALLLAALNREIEDTDRDLKIGPSYLMRPEAASEAGLARIWRHDILPLLEEHYYGRLSRAELLDRFGLPTLQRRLQRDRDTGDEGPGDADADANDGAADEASGESMQP
jgi:MoxR-like ATPase